MDDNLLGEFLRARRERVDPATLGLRAMGVRRTPGLRREEVAARAGISVEYLVRLERGRDRRPSAAVVGALADVLQLDGDGAAHLARLAALPVDRGGDVVDDISPMLRRLLDSWPNPTIVTNSLLDLIGTNAAGEELHRGIGLRVGDNMARSLFLDPRSQAVFVDYDTVARESVGNLRALSGANPSHPRLVELVGELSIRSDLFARLWGEGEVQAKTNGGKVIAHPDLGVLELEWSTLEVAAAPGQLVVAYQAREGTPSVRAIDALVARVARTS
ncbi:helix-turn-helix transcriptional regulator [Tsukamurella paurometabola]|uniref:Transcriptional regulator, XRE family n=1 Tax=Tsukamurella paurometabola (strain ATCC 8368 / DSM 20162 / CCUG 35730 / CIP 100753 / JCM 10117 / KCTC 9821 / NBRC 16120 / NCIMB 702349 / NCTC 13040) TaxID=521096 RepID=D5UY41_TSUPD|nr:helix-turn-helix transcriptional regulator [Tsukamurella paurometabola]ADG80278.1 transcriptional regulator, XRE family [Tsukamurella paurometabola DSM 20162]